MTIQWFTKCSRIAEKISGENSLLHLRYRERLWLFRQLSSLAEVRHLPLTVA